MSDGKDDKTRINRVITRSGDDGRTLSTPWIIDDPAVFVFPRHAARTAQRDRRGSGRQISAP